jgi:hypothetical protein
MSGYTGRAYTQNAGLDLNKDGSVTKEEASKKVKEYLPKTSQVKGGMGGLGVDPSMFAPEERAKLAMSISQPPPSQAKPSVVTLPGITGGQQQSSGGGGGGQVIIPPTNPLGDSGPSIPILPSSDSANFLTMYSKIVYNIVDG